MNKILLVGLIVSVIPVMTHSMRKDSKIYVAGHRGLVGSALMRCLKRDGFTNLITASFDELDLRNQEAVNAFFEKHEPDYVFLAAAKVGGIKANMDYPARFIYDNMMIAANVIHAAYLYKVKKLLFLGSSCIYPRNCPQPMCEEHLLSSPLEKTNEPYAVAKIAGIKLCQSYNREYGTNFIACMPTNLYGPGDNFDLNNAHVLPALMAKFHEAKMTNQPHVVVWGTGAPYREFLHVDDCAQALVFLMDHYNDNEIINVGTGIDVTIAEVARIMADVVGFTGDIVFDTSKPDGTPRKLLNVDKLNHLGWYPSFNLRDGLEDTYTWYVSQQKTVGMRKRGSYAHAQ